MRLTAISPDGEITENEVQGRHWDHILDTYNKYHMYVGSLPVPRIVVMMSSDPILKANEVGSLLATHGEDQLGGVAYVGTYSYDPDTGEYQYGSISPETVLDLYALRKRQQHKGTCHIL